MERSARIYVAGHRGLVGSAICRSLRASGYDKLVLRTHAELDLCDQAAVQRFFQEEQPEYVFLAAARVGGIQANNSYRADFIYQNLSIQNHVVHQSHLNGVRKLLLLGSTCVYPRDCSQPIVESSLLTGPLEYTNEPYAIAKIAGLKLIESYNLQYGCNFLAVMPTNLYGLEDTFDLDKSHVLPALMRKFHLARLLAEGDEAGLLSDVARNGGQPGEAWLSLHGIDSTSVTLWGDGTPRREFLWADDLADACLHVMQRVDWKDLAQATEPVRNTHINIGWGQDLRISELAEMIREIVGFHGEVRWDARMPSGTPQKRTDTTRMRSLGWEPRVTLKEGLQRLYSHYLGMARQRAGDGPPA